MVVRPDGYTYVTLNVVQRCRCGLGAGTSYVDPSGYYADAAVVNVRSEASRTERRSRRQGNASSSNVQVVSRTPPVLEISAAEQIYNAMSYGDWIWHTNQLIYEGILPPWDESLN